MCGVMPRSTREKTAPERLLRVVACNSGIPGTIMKPYPCPNCGRPNHFEVRVCPNCTFTLGYDPKGDQFLFLGDGATTWRDAAGGEHALLVCANNNRYKICNWLVPSVGDQPLCLACKHNRT